jgi:hypothetical protein
VNKVFELNNKPYYNIKYTTSALRRYLDYPRNTPSSQNPTPYEIFLQTDQADVHHPHIRFHRCHGNDDCLGWRAVSLVQVAQVLSAFHSYQSGAQEQIMLHILAV